ncbi:peptide-methionine (R)-S-oxide reductase MsrB [Jannaschia sp. KMU-145]|uniref:peptide-methionine (R)-S-oxide reductase MsrB n=1 Tax=Jannaschia halovivens TaxID=3388667 RepID=UPI00396B3CCA
MPSRRAVLTGTAAVAALGAAGSAWWLGSDAPAPRAYPVSLTEAEWRARLSPGAFAVLRQEDTEAPYSSPLDDFWEAGTYDCAGCANPVYASDTKFDSGTGWPSFWAPLAEDAVGTKTDYKLVLPRTEVHCARCGGHLGHIFTDGPDPTGKRHCLNGLALAFRPEGEPAAPLALS